MKYLIKLHSLFFAVTMLATSVYSANVKLDKINFSTKKSDFPTVKFVEGGDVSWKSSPPTFTIDENNIKAEGSFAVSEKFLHLYLKVYDQNHDPRGNVKTAWQGDSIQIGIDALGDSPDKEVPPDYTIWDEQIAANNKKIEEISKTTKRWQVAGLKKANEKLKESKRKAATPQSRRNLLDGNDAKFTIALSKGGKATIFADQHGVPGRTGERTDIIANITRDEKNKVTIYDISFPWTEFGISKLFSDTFQFILMVNNTTENVKEKTVVVFGKSPFGIGASFKPWYFHRFNTELPSTDFAEIIETKTSVYNKDDSAETIIGLSTGKDYTIEVDVDDKKTTKKVSLKNKKAKRLFFKLYINPQSKNPKSKVAIKINDKSFESIIKNESMEDWWTWNPKNSTAKSVIGMENWLDAPAGKHGRLIFDGKDFKFEKTGKKVKLWGVNLSYAQAAPKTKELADFTAAHFAKYGINVVRMHKFAYGKNSGIGDKNDATKWDMEKLKNLDYFWAKLKEKGIYVLIDPFFGFSVKPGNKNDVLFYDEAKKNGGTGLVNLAPDIQKLMIKKMTNLLEHKNPYTGMTYASDPMVVIVEMQNEDDIFWGNTMSVMMRADKYRKKFAAKFVDWLIKKYGSAEAAKTAWGKNSLNVFPEFERNGVKESFETKYIIPICNPWYLGIKNIAKMQLEKNVTKRLQDTAEFLFETQMTYYKNYEKAIKKTGYNGVLEASCWQAGSDLPHYLNMYSDYLIGVIDRHNYYSGTGSWVMRAGDYNSTPDFLKPGAGLLSSGVQQVADRPFLFSEWDANSPYQWRAATTTMIAYYGMGLQGWDGSMQFQANPTGFTKTIQSSGNNVFNMSVPEGLGLYPALARSIYRNDIKEAEIVSARKVNIKSLLKGIIDFDESVEQQGDLKVFTGDLPNEALAYGRTVVEFTDKQEKSTFPDMTKMLKNKKIISQTKELEWDYANPGEAHYIVNTKGTKAFAGFPPEGEIKIGDVKIKLQNRFATIILTSLDKNKDIKNSKNLLLTCIARSRNTGMQYNESETRLNKVGFSPIIMEPVFAKIEIPGAKKVTVLDCDGLKTDKTKSVKNGIININGLEDKTIYYLINK